MNDESMRERFEETGAGGEWSYPVDWDDPSVRYAQNIWRAAWQAATLAERERIGKKLRRAGANLPAPKIAGTIESAMVTGLSVALAIVEVDPPAAIRKGES